MNGEVFTQLDVLSSIKGHDKEKITIKDDNPKKRAKLAEKIIALIRDGFRVTLNDGTKVLGYNAKTNEWLVASDDRKKKKETKRVSAAGKPANAIAPIAGG